MNIKTLLGKIAAGETVTAAEKAFLVSNKDILSTEQAAVVDSAVVEDAAEDVDEKALSALINKSVAEAVDSISTKLATKFADSIAAERAKAIDTVVATPVSKADEKTKSFMKALFTGDHAHLKAVSGLSDGVGGYLIPDELRAEVLRVAEKQYGLARRDMRYLPFAGAGNERRIPALSGSVAVTWTDEAAAKTSTAPSFGIVTQTLKKLAAIVPMTEEIIEDSAINLTSLVAELFAEAVAKEEDLQFFNGNGTVWTGILNNGSVNVTRTSTSNATSITADDLLDMQDATPTGALSGAKYYMHRTVFGVVRKLKAATTGEYIVQQPTGTDVATIWGYPVELSDAFPTLAASATVSKPIVLFGNLKVAAIFGDKQQLRVKMLDQATIRNVADDANINLAQQDMVAVRIVERVGYVLAIPSAVTVLKTKAS